MIPCFEGAKFTATSGIATYLIKGYTLYHKNYVATSNSWIYLAGLNSILYWTLILKIVLWFKQSDSTSSLAGASTWSIATSLRAPREA